MKEANNNIPQHWRWAKISELCNVVRGGSPRPAGDPKYYDGSIPFLKVRDLTKDNNTYLTTFEYTIKEAGLHKTRKIAPNTLLLSNSGATLGVPKICMINATMNDGIAAFLDLDKRSNLFLYYFWVSKTRELRNINMGAAQPNLNTDIIKNYLIPLPPLPEQVAIVNKIEELFSELENGKEQLLTAQRQLKIYRQSLLKAAFEGRLTNDSLDLPDYPDSKSIPNTKSRKSLNQENQGADNLPLGWKWVKLGEVCEINRGKSKHRPRNEPSLFGGKYPFIQTGDIRAANGGYINNFSQTYSEKGLQQSKLWAKGTLCITIAANIGETAILGLDACFPDSVVGLVCNENLLLNKYTNYFFISHKSKLEELAPATAQKNINVDILEKVNIPLPPLPVQQAIVEILESKLTVCDKLEETISHSLEQTETLRQSILKKAFEGKLYLD